MMYTIQSLRLSAIYLTFATATAVPPSPQRDVETPGHQYPPHLPTVYLCGDSTMALNGDAPGTGIEGWGEYLQYSLNSKEILVNNSALAGTSGRSYTRKDLFNYVEKALRPGDWVVIEFGHNDGGSPYPASADNGRADCPGDGNQTCPTVYANAMEIVQTYDTYIIEASKMFLAKGARETGNYTYAPNRFTYYAWLAVAELGGPSAGVYFVPHGQYTAQAMFNLGLTVVDANYPIDHTHTSPYLAGIVAQSFVLGLKCGTSPLQNLIVNATARIEGTVLGTCILVNSTLPI